MVFCYQLLSKFLVIISLLIQYSLCVLITDIKVPKSVLNGDDIALQCNYRLDRESLYALKWHFNNFEFYRYTPRDFPPKQKFPLSVFDIDMDASTNNTVYVRRVSKLATGWYKCEISVEHTFQTVFKENFMSVVANSSATIQRTECYSCALTMVLFATLNNLFVRR